MVTVKCVDFLWLRMTDDSAEFIDEHRSDAQSCNVILWANISCL